MLIRFNVKNFLSFDSEDRATHDTSSQEFSMIPGKVRSKEDHILKTDKQNLLKFAAIYGANAAGKSNLIKAMAFYRDCALIGAFPMQASDMYCKNDSSNKDKPSYFEAEFTIDDEVFAYGFEVILSTGVFVSEWLCKLSPTKEEYLFKKEDAQHKYIFGGPLEKNEMLKVLVSSFAGSNGLFLNFINRTMAGFYKTNPKAEVLRSAFNWIVRNLDINFPANPLSTSSFLANEEALCQASKLLKAFGTGIEDVKSVQVPLEKVAPFIPPHWLQDMEKQMELSNTPKNDIFIRDRNEIFVVKMERGNKDKAYSIQFKHNFQNATLFKMAEESDGTARLFDLLEILLSKSSKTYVIDELDRCLHPCLSYQFVKAFFEYSRNRNVQLIVTTHESRLMDFDLLRRDEIWFVDKDQSGASNIYSLEEYNERFDKKIDKAYLEGRYGGVPLFTSIFPIKEA